VQWANAGAATDPAIDARSETSPISTTADAGSSVAASANVSGPTSLSPSQATSSAPTADAATPSPVGDQITGQVVHMVTVRSHDVVMRLQPPELGDLLVRVAVNGRDVSAWFASPHPVVQTAISEAIGQLQSDLSNAGYNLNGAWVGGDPADTNRRGSNTAGPSGQPATAATSSVSNLAATTAPAVSSGLNLYV
jgi:flagellar hook-length control protein FliK